jgi:hypothetical protein
MHSTDLLLLEECTRQIRGLSAMRHCAAMHIQQATAYYSSCTQAVPAEHSKAVLMRQYSNPTMPQNARQYAAALRQPAQAR